MTKGRERFASVPSKTAVWVDLDTCTFPDGFKPGCIRPMIISALRKESPAFDLEPQQVTIFAIGNLLRIPPQHNEALSSSGVRMRHAHFGLDDISADLNLWKSYNPPPATLMFITKNPMAEGRFQSRLPIRLPEEPPYTVLHAYPGNSLGWDSLVKGTRLLKTPSDILADSTEPPWRCRQCRFDCENYWEFTVHLFGPDHEQSLAEAASMPLKYFKIYQEFLVDKEKLHMHMGSRS